MTFSCLKNVENYVRCQPSYPRKLFDYLYSDAGFSRESVIADIGSGTGLFTRLLLERGSRVVAIEPDAPMREVAQRLLNDEFMRFVSLNAKAENTTLFNKSVNHIVCAHSFHRFNIDECKKEFNRILKPEGKVVLIWNNLNYEDEITMEYQQLICKWMAPGCNDDCNDSLLNQVPEFFKQGSYENISFLNPQVVDLNGFKGRFLSNDNIPSQGETAYNEMMEELLMLFERVNRYSKIQICYKTDVHIGQL